jgi:site-specific DNA-methyltransferase (adenine-specific)
MEDREGKGKDCYKYEHYCGDSNHVKMNKVKKFYDADLVNPSSVLLFNVVPNRNGKLHPTQKPVELFEYLIKTYSNENDIVLDNCIGSGTTAIACLNTKRNYIGIEKDDVFFQKANERVAQWKKDNVAKERLENFFENQN